MVIMLGDIQKLPISNSKYADADFIIFGVPSDKGSAYRKGSRYAPNSIRDFVSKNEIGAVIKNHKKSIFEPGTSKFSASVCDIGNIKIGKEEDTALKIYSDKKIPVAIGGDHSITYRLLNGMQPNGKWGIIYFDAHADIISSRGSYFGSVIHDMSKIKGFSPESSFIIGLRTPEEEELDNIKDLGINTITALDIEESGIKNIAKRILPSIKKNTYISIDMDSIDPAFAPGVTEPEPAGISPNQLIYLAKKVAEKSVFGFDIMEVCPKYDHDGMTMYLAYRMILEIITSMDSKIR